MTSDGYQMVECLDDLEDMLDTIGVGIAALDFETTAFSPAEEHVRLVQIYNEDGWWVVDFFAIGRDLGAKPVDGFRKVAHWFAAGIWIVFNAGFEMMWFEDATDVPITCWDVAFLRKAVLGGGHFSLANALKQDLDYDMPKEEQASDWSVEPLRQEQLDYAADDALWTWNLWQHWEGKADEGNLEAFDLLNDMQPAVLEMQRNGMRLDHKVHKALVDKWRGLEEKAVSVIREYVDDEDVANLNSGAQWNDFFNKILPDEYLSAWPQTEKTGLLSMANDVLLEVAALFSGTPIYDLIMAKRELTTLRKYISSFGDNLIFAADNGDGRIKARYNIAAARTCRFSCSGPNLQQIPRDREMFGEFMSVRQSFIAEPGNELASLDYSGIELRVLALLSGDEQLLHDLIDGDLHLEVGSFWQGRRLDKSVPEDKEWRSRAKSVSFGLIFGSTELGIAGQMGVSISKAEELVNFWATRYPKAFGYKDLAAAQAERDGGYLRVVDGGTIYMGKRVKSTQAANYPVQRGALSIMARAIARHKDTLDAHKRRQDVMFLSTIHDALIDETKIGLGEEILQLMARDMKAAYLDIFPGAPVEKLLEGGVGPSWGELEEKEF